jgi:class 3 adenylate cyclase
MGSLPSGIVAILMTDVEASTAAWNESPGATDAAVAALDADVQRIADEHEGTVVKARGEGDSHFVAFAQASRAVRAAAALQRRADRRLLVRAAVVVAELTPRGDDYLGAEVNHAARLRSVAHGGQVVATRAVVDLTQALNADRLTFRSLGLHRVRDLPTAVEVHQLLGPGLRDEFPPLRSSDLETAVLMAVVAVDGVDTRRAMAGADDHAVIEWQRTLVDGLREATRAHDGRCLKLLGDGCLVAFEDPRRALAFADQVHGLGPFRIGVALGLIEDLGGELGGRTVMHAHRLMRPAGAGETRCCPVTQAVCGTSAHHPPPRVVGGVH